MVCADERARTGSRIGSAQGARAAARSGPMCTGRALRVHSDARSGCIRVRAQGGCSPHLLLVCIRVELGQTRHHLRTRHAMPWVEMGLLTCCDVCENLIEASAFAADPARRQRADQWCSAMAPAGLVCSVKVFPFPTPSQHNAVCGISRPGDPVGWHTLTPQASRCPPSLVRSAGTCSARTYRRSY